MLATIGEDVRSYPILKREVLAVLLLQASNEGGARYAEARRTRDLLDRLLGAELSTNDEFKRARGSDRRMDE